MHIGIDASSWANERGFGRFTRCLVHALAERDSGFRYTLLFDQAPEAEVPEGVDVVVAGSDESLAEASAGTSARSGSYMLRMGAAAKRLNCDVFYFPAVYSYFPIFSSVPKVICYHDTIPERFPDLIFPSKKNFRLWQAKTKLARWQASRVMTVSEASADDLSKFLKIPRGKIDVVTEGADEVFRPIRDADLLERARAQCGIPQAARVLTYVGGFNRHKNVLRLIEAMPQVIAAHPDVYLAIVGRTSGDRFWDNIDELKSGASRDSRASGRIGFTGEIDDETLAQLLNLSEALVFPSLWEGFGLPAVEAMACGTPVLASDRGSLPEVLGEAGLFFEPTDKDDIAGKIIGFLSDPDQRQALSEKALARNELFNWDRGAELAEVSFRRAAVKG